MRSFGGEKMLAERKWPELSEAEERLHGAIVPEMKARAIQPKEFADLYGAETVKNDELHIASLEEKFRTGNKDPEAKDWAKRGELFEAIVADQIESSDWLGGNASVIVPSRYDDVVNGVDSIVEFEEETARTHLALAVDVTKSSKHIDKKFDAIRDSIERGQLSRVKYFRSRDVRGELREVPRVVIGADEHTMQEVAELLLLFKTRQKHPTAGKPGEFREVRAKLEKHRLQFQLLFEIKAQLESFAALATKLGKVRIAEKYENTLKVIAKILEAKNQDTDYSETSPGLKDSVYKAIMAKAMYFGK